MSETAGQSESQPTVVPERATQGAETQGRKWSWVQATVWSERMLAALENGVKGDKWFSLIDKVQRIQTLQAAWQKVVANAGAAGVDEQSVKQFAAREEIYLEELEGALKTEKYRPEQINHSVYFDDVAVGDSSRRANTAR